MGQLYLYQPLNWEQKRIVSLQNKEKITTGRLEKKMTKNLIVQKSRNNLAPVLWELWTKH